MPVIFTYIDPIKNQLNVEDMDLLEWCLEKAPNIFPQNGGAKWWFTMVQIKQIISNNLKQIQEDQPSYVGKYTKSHPWIHHETFALTARSYKKTCLR